MTRSTDVMDKFSAAPFHKSLASSVHLDHQDLKDNQETKAPEDQKERTEKMVRTATLDHRVWLDPLEIKARLVHPDYPVLKESPDVSIKLTVPRAHTAWQVLLAELDRKVFPAPMESPEHQDQLDPLATQAVQAKKVSQARPDSLETVAPLAKLELAIIVQPQELHQDIRGFRQNGKHSKTLILGAIFLQETVLFDNAQFLCFIFFVLWHTTR